VDGHRAGCRFDHPVDHPQRGRLAAPGRADEHGDGAIGRTQTQVVGGHGRTGDPFGHALQLDHPRLLPVGYPPTYWVKTSRTVERGTAETVECSHRGCWSLSTRSARTPSLKSGRCSRLALTTVSVDNTW